ncbi:hypothetical protein AMJ52_00665 [candidate division TA06 bacterium DG_78]|uniref:Uncharacterized protein n=1 Tax=candidate division TA06 bacterium DG_78 TaxID=1703772 RepID=A0A0S7YJK6_UNCT6|nr:MAG: hypothetical protein AMJ52_00665 [candidate division TA06 bacterium DG_78]
MKKIIIIIAIMIVTFLIIKVFLPNEKNLVARDIKSLKNAVEREDKMSILEYLDESYMDKHNITYEHMVNAIDEFFLQVDSIQIFRSGMKISIDSVDGENNTYASCSLGLKILANLEGEKVLVYGGVFKPSPVRAWFKKIDRYYRVYYAEY